MDLFEVDDAPHISDETFSTYVDGRLTAIEFEGVNRHLQLCSDCELGLQMLKETVTVLHQTEMIAVPRSFVLSEVEKSIPKILFFSPGAFRLGMAAAAAALIFVIAGDLTGIIRSSSAEIPVQVGMAERGILITPGSQPTPEQPLVTGGSSLTQGTLPADNVISSAPSLPTADGDSLAVDREGRIAWWHVVLGLISVAMLTVAVRKNRISISPRR